jgi:hypothetical protein
VGPCHYAALLALQRHYAKHIRIADAALRECNDFLGDKSCRWVGTNFEMQGVACCYEGS